LYHLIYQEKFQKTNYKKFKKKKIKKKKK